MLVIYSSYTISLLSVAVKSRIDLKFYLYVLFNPETMRERICFHRPHWLTIVVLNGVYLFLYKSNVFEQEMAMASHRWWTSSHEDVRMKLETRAMFRVGACRNVSLAECQVCYNAVCVCVTRREAIISTPRTHDRRRAPPPPHRTRCYIIHEPLIIYGLDTIHHIWKLNYQIFMNLISRLHS